MSWDRTWINTDIISKNHNKELVIEDCPIYELEFKSKKNIPISFFDKNLILEDISYDELTSNLNDKNCDTKNERFIVIYMPRLSFLDTVQKKLYL